MKKESFLRISICLVLILSSVTAFSQKRQSRVNKKPEQAQNQIQQKYSVYFDVNQAKIKSSDYLVLDSVVKLLKTDVNLRRIQINGYADTTGGAEANLELSERRTDTVANYILGNDLMAFKSKVATASLGEKVSGKEADLNEMRRVDIVLFLSKPDRDTMLQIGCVSAYIKANTFENFNNEEVKFELEYIGSAEEATNAKIEFVDEDGSKMLSNGVVRLKATYRGKDIPAVQNVVIKCPKINSETGYSIYKGTEDRQKNITWKITDTKVSEGGKSQSLEGENCDQFAVETSDLNTYLNIEKKWPDCYCSGDPFGGVQNPEKSNDFAKFGKDKSIVVLNNSCFKKVDASTTYFKLYDDLYPDTYLNFCNGYLLPGVGKIPDLKRYDSELIKFIDFDVSQKNDSADMLMVKRSKILILIPKSKFPEHAGKSYAILPAETNKDNYLEWSTKPVFNEACIGLVNCEYWVFEAPFTGFYSLLELTPSERKSKRKSKNAEDEDESDEVQEKLVRVKTKKFNDVLLVYGLKEEDKTQTAQFLKNKGKHSFNQPDIIKKEKKDYYEHIFMAYVLKGGKRYAWIGKGSELKKNFFNGHWKTAKLQYIPDEDWEDFVKKACE
jgi:hypothetical protein